MYSLLLFYEYHGLIELVTENTLLLYLIIIHILFHHGVGLVCDCLAPATQSSYCPFVQLVYIKILIFYREANYEYVKRSSYNSGLTQYSENAAYSVASLRASKSKSRATIQIVTVPPRSFVRTSIKSMTRDIPP